MTDMLGKYELLHVLGKGAMGTVYQGFDPIIARKVAIKTIKQPDAEDAEAQEEFARFKREAQAAGRLSHPNIVGVFDYGETAEIAYIVMEYVDGTTLKHVVDKKERFELAEVVRLMDGLMNGLQYSHDRGVVHRDIKPANIMLTKAGEVKIADFGIARIESSSMTQAGTMLGTPSYMSPEQFMGQTVDSRTDLYSSGVMLYQLLTGEKPFEGGLTAIMHKVLNTEPPPPSALSVTVPYSFDLVVQRAMAKRPEDRFASATEFARALKDSFENKTMAGPAPVSVAAEFGDGDSTMVMSGATAARPEALAEPAPVRAAVAPAIPAPAPTPAPQAKKSPPMALLGGAAVVVLALLGGGAYLVLGHGPAPQPAAVATPAPIPAPAAAAPMTTAQRDTAISGALSSVPCTLLTGTDTGAQPMLTGIVGGDAAQAALSGELLSLPAAIRPASTAQTIDGPYCDALNAIQPYHSLFGNPAMQLGLTLAGGKNTLHKGALITVHDTMPGFSGYLETDYFSSDGTVLHLYPTPTDALKLQPSGTVKTLGDPTSGGAAWQVSAPYGTDLIISIATTSPLFPGSRPQEEDAGAYLQALRQALQKAAAAGENVSVSALPVVTLP
jgi:eukaryotic-like serine/threonine-protein kinase